MACARTLLPLLATLCVVRSITANDQGALRVRRSYEKLPPHDSPSSLSVVEAPSSQPRPRLSHLSPDEASYLLPVDGLPPDMHVVPNTHTLHLTTPPKITKGPGQETAYQESKPVDLICKASGTPDIVYEWKRNEARLEIDGVQIRQLPGSGTLQIEPGPEGEDEIEGVYQCFAENDFGRAVSVKSVLKKAYIKAFEPHEPMHLRPRVGEYMNLTCNPPESYPKASVYWVSGSGENFQNVPLSKRVALDYDGNLHFANIEEDDSTKNKPPYTCTIKNEYLRQTAEGSDSIVTVLPRQLHFANVEEEDSYNSEPYVCTVQNSVLRSLSQGDDKIVEVMPIIGTPSSIAPKLVWSSPQSVTAIEGEFVKMMCIFSGYPTPDVAWTRIDGKPLAPGTNMRASSGLEVRIMRARAAHAGRYRCTARSAAPGSSEVSRDFNLVVQYKPTWAEGVAPPDVTASDGEDAAVTCAAEGDPPPQWSFSFNGVTLGNQDAQDDYHYVPDEKRMRIEGDTVYFKNLTKTDTQVIQCNVSNVHGYTFTNVFLNVLAEPPYFIESPMAIVKKAEGQEVILTCRVFGAPKPTVTWFRGTPAKEVVGPRFTTLPEGDLKIVSAVREDATTYTCLARNKFGEEQASGQLLIRERTKIDYRPRNKIVEAKAAVVFFCNATTDPDEVSWLSIEWLRNGEEINYFTSGMSKNMRDNSLQIPSAQPEDSGSYTCVASNSVDEDTATATLQVKDRPDPPSRVRLDACINAGSQVQWTPGSENNDPVLEYIVKYNTSFDAEGVYHVAAKVGRGQHEAQMSVSPWTNYTYHVLARNSLGVSDPSPFTSQPCTTEPQRPRTDPAWVCTSSEEPDQLVIRWQTFPEIHHNGSNFHYVVRYRRADPRADRQQVIELNVTEWDQGVYRVANQPTYTRYEISVKTANELGESDANQAWKQGYSGEDVPEVTPANFGLDRDSVNATHAMFYWDSVDTSLDKINGFFKGYRLVYWRDSDPDTRRHTDIIKNEVPECPPESSQAAGRRFRRAVTEEGVAGNLWPFSDISAAIQVMNGGKSGALSDPPISFTTPEGVPGPVGMFRVSEVGSHHLKVEWLPPLALNGILMEYRLGYLEVGSSAGMRFLEPLDISRLHKKIHGLDAERTYEVYIWAYTRAGRGVMMRDEATTKPASAPDMPGLLDDLDIGDTWVNVSWAPSGDDRPNNPGSEFYIEYKPKGSDEWERTDPPEKEHNWYNLTDLEPGEMEIRVVAVNSLGHETRSPPKTVYIGPRGGPAIEDAATAGVASKGWFIGLMIILIFLLLVLLIVCLIRRNRGGKYPVHEKEKLAGRDPEKEDEEAGFGEYTKNDLPEKKKSRTSLNSEERPLESDTDSMAEYYNTDPSKFNEDGSFIGQYGGKKKAEPDTTSPSALSTFV